MFYLLHYYINNLFIDTELKLKTTEESTSTHFGIMQQMLYNLFNSQVQHYPFPHWYTQNIFPKDFFWELRKHLPDKETYTDYSEDSTTLYSKENTNKANKYLFNLERYNLKLLKEDQNIFWNKFLDAFSNDFFLVSILKFILPFFNQQEQQEIQKGSISLEWNLVKNSSDFILFPHTDVSLKLLSLLFYIPSSQENFQCGTTIFIPKIEKFSKDPSLKKQYLTDHYLGFDLFHKLKKFPYIPNSLFGFIRTDNSFHAVEPLKEKSIERDVLHFSIQNKKKEIRY